MILKEIIDRRFKKETNEKKLSDLYDKKIKECLNNCSFANEEELNNVVEKMAVWYELRYPDSEVNKVIPIVNVNIGDVDEKLFMNNKYVQNNAEPNESVNVFEWSKFYGYDSFINLLSHIELRYFQSPVYGNIYYYEPGKAPHFHVTPEGIVDEVEYLGYIDCDLSSVGKLEGLTFVDAVDRLIECGVEFPDTSEMKIKYDAVVKMNITRNAILNAVMVRIMERSKNYFGARRALMFASEFGADLSVPVRYGCDRSDPGLRNFINEYIKAGGNPDDKIFMNYFKTIEDGEVREMTVRDVLRFRYADPLNKFTNEEKLLHQRLVTALGYGTERKMLEQRLVDALSIELEEKQKIKKITK